MLIVIFRRKEIAIDVLNLNLTSVYLKTKVGFDGLLLLRVCASNSLYLKKKNHQRIFEHIIFEDIT